MSKLQESLNRAEDDLTRVKAWVAENPWAEETSAIYSGSGGISFGAEDAVVIFGHYSYSGWAGRHCLHREGSPVIYLHFPNPQPLPEGTEITEAFLKELYQIPA